MSFIIHMSAQSVCGQYVKNRLGDRTFSKIPRRRFVRKRALEINVPVLFVSNFPNTGTWFPYFKKKNRCYIVVNFVHSGKCTRPS